MEGKNSVNIELIVDPGNVDADGFVSLWNAAAAVMHGDEARTRHLAGNLLGFLCTQRYPFVVVSPADARYLDEWFERDKSLLYDWSPESEKIDVLAQHAHVPLESFSDYLCSHKFDAARNYSPRRAVREEWYNDDWSVG